MNQPIFTYNQEQAIKAGQPAFISETGAYICTILSAEYIQSKGGALALEFTLETEEGLKANYIDVYYQGKDGNLLNSGQNMIQAIMGCTGAKQLTQVFKDGKAFAPEIEGKKVGLMLQKVLRTKQDGSDTYSFQILCPFSANSRKTLAEHLENRPAERIAYLVEHTKDKDERDKQQQAYNTQHQYYTSTAPMQPVQGNPNSELGDDIPF